MTLAAEAGATIYPLIPSFYNRPESLDEIARNFVHRVLKHIGLPQKGRLCVEAGSRRRNDRQQIA